MTTTATTTTNKDVILNAWRTRDDDAVVREVVTKGEHIQDCLEYLAEKRNLSIEESITFFDEAVNAYVYRLLSDKLVCKAEIVLKNLNRDFRSVYYQYAFECEDEIGQKCVLEYIKKKDSEIFPKDKCEHELFWQIIKESENFPHIAQRLKSQLKEVNLEKLFQQTDDYKIFLLTEMFFTTGNEKYLENVAFNSVWKFLVENNVSSELVVWFYAQQKLKVSRKSILRRKYESWILDKNMLNFAVENLKNPTNVLRNCFAKKGYIFPDEINDNKKILARIITSESFEINKHFLPPHLSIAQYLGEKELYGLLLEDFIKYEELDVLKGNDSRMDFILCLKQHNLSVTESIIILFKKITEYLMKSNRFVFGRDHPMLALLNFTLSNSDMNADNQNYFHSMKGFTFMEKLLKRYEPPISTKITVYDMLKKLKNIDFDEMTKDIGTEVDFASDAICQKYSQKLKISYLHYLKQNRSSYVMYHFCIEQLKGYSKISKYHIFASVEIVAEFAVRHYYKDDVVLHSIAFLEMLGFDTQYLRSLIKLIKLSISTERRSLSFTEILETSEKLLFGNLPEISVQHFSLMQFSMIMDLVESHNFSSIPKIILSRLANEDDWWKILIFIQYFNVPLNHLKKIIRDFKTPIIEDHLLRALSNDCQQDKGKRRLSFSRQKSTMSTSISSSHQGHLLQKCKEIKLAEDMGDMDLFALVLLSSNKIGDESVALFAKFMENIIDSNFNSLSLNLTKNCVKYNLPILSILSVTVIDVNLHWNWLIWLAVSTGTIQILETSKTTEEATLKLIESSVINGFPRKLHNSFEIFYKDNKFSYFTKFLHLTSDLDFSEETADLLRLYLLAWSNKDAEIPKTNFNKDKIMEFSVRLLILHLNNNLSSAYHQKMLLTIICQSGISDINQIVDFCLLRNVFDIISFSGVTINFENLLISSEESTIHPEYENVLQNLQDLNHYVKSIQLATLLGLPISDIIFSKWMSSLNTKSFKIDFEMYKKETDYYNLAPEILVKFYLDVAYQQIPDSTPEKYLLLKKSLDVLKKNRLLPNECFDSDQIEYEMILCFLQSEQNVEELDIYHSEYFEEILLNERCVLYKSFSELKSLAGIEDLTTSLKYELTESMKLKLACLLNRLLDEGDIVEALRLQAMFEYCPIDLRFIVFCMGLAEGLTTINDLPKDERQKLLNIENISISKFHKRTLDRLRLNPDASINKYETMDNTSFGFEEIPSRQRKEVLDALQGVASRLSYGLDIGKRIVMVYRAAMHLEKDYLDVLRMKDTLYLLKSITEEDCLQKLLVVSDILTSTKMTPSEIAEYLSFEMAAAIIRLRFYIFQSSQSVINLSLHAQNIIWGHYDLDKEFHLFLELCPNTTILGNAILDYCDALKIYRKFQDKKVYEDELENNSQLEVAFNGLCQIILTYGQPNTQQQGTTAQVLSHKKQNTICVELLIKAHECFVHECSMAGIANVLNRAKTLNNILTTAKSWNLIVRMLIGIGRFREMYYCFDTLIENDQFESLLGQFDEEKTSGLRQGIVSYIRERCPENQECLKLVALHFLMYKDLAEMWEQEANSLTAKLISQNQIIDETAISSSTTKNCDNNKSSKAILKCSPQVINNLNQILDCLSHATENYLLDNKLRLAKKSVSKAELVAVQIDLVNKSLATPSQNAICLLDVRTKNEFKELVNTELRVSQALILSRAYSYEISWPEAILSQYILLGKSYYLEEYINNMELRDSIIEAIVKSFQLQSQILPKMEENLARLVGLVQSVSLRYKLASILGLKRIIADLINDEQSLYYLKDTNYGRNENDFPDG